MRTVNKVRRFGVGDSLNTIFSARQFGLALAVDIERALKDFPKHEDGDLVEEGFGDVTVPIWTGAFEVRLDEWKEKWFSEFIEISEDGVKE